MASFRKGTSGKDHANKIRSVLSAEDVVSKYWDKPNRSGFVRCPFHQGDNTPSLKVYPDDGGWHCFGCGEGGDVIGFVMKYFEISFPEAVRRLDGDFNLGLGLPQSTSEQDILRLRESRKKAERKETDEYADLIAKCQKLYRHYADIVCKDEQYLEDPFSAPEEWLDACMAVEYLNYVINGAETLLAEVEEVAR